MTWIGCGYAMDLPSMMGCLPWCNLKRTASFFSFRTSFSRWLYIKWKVCKKVVLGLCFLIPCISHQGTGGDYDLLNQVFELCHVGIRLIWNLLIFWSSALSPCLMTLFTCKQLVLIFNAAWYICPCNLKHVLHWSSSLEMWLTKKQVIQIPFTYVATDKRLLWFGNH